MGTPYDFHFDFADTERLVCTQLVSLAFEGMLHFELRQILGRTTLPPLDIARKYVEERRQSDRQFDFVLFLDAAPEQHPVTRSGEESFCGTLERPRALAEQ